MSIPQSTVDRLFVASARHCCICRRYRPLNLNIHHIIELNEGGTDDYDNLMPICISCHSDVHTETKLSRRFTKSELILHRNVVFELVAKGVLPNENHSGDNSEALASQIIKQLQTMEIAKGYTKPALSSQAVEVLLAAICEESAVQVTKTSEVFFVFISGRVYISFSTNKVNKYPDHILSLLENGFLLEAGDKLKVTSAGHSFADDLIKTEQRVNVIKVKCLKCRLHFMLFSWETRRHNSGNLHCPECGQYGEQFMVGRQKEFGTISQFVFGHTFASDIRP